MAKLLPKKVKKVLKSLGFILDDFSVRKLSGQRKYIEKITEKDYLSTMLQEGISHKGIDKLPYTGITKDDDIVIIDESRNLYINEKYLGRFIKSELISGYGSSLYEIEYFRVEGLTQFEIALYENGYKPTNKITVDICKKPGIEDIESILKIRKPLPITPKTLGEIRTLDYNADLIVSCNGEIIDINEKIENEVLGEINPKIHSRQDIEEEEENDSEEEPLDFSGSAPENILSLIKEENMDIQALDFERLSKANKILDYKEKLYKTVNNIDPETFKVNISGLEDPSKRTHEDRVLKGRRI